MPEHSQQPERSRLWPATIALLVLLLAYPFSYAPVVRMRGGWDTWPATDGYGDPAMVRRPLHSEQLPAYRPVDWMIDHTPMRAPLLWWADVCGVGRPFRESAAWWR